MPWKECGVVGERLRLVRTLLRGEKSVCECSRIFGVSRRIAYKWRARFLAGGRAALRDKSRRPLRQPQAVAQRWQRRLRVVHRQQESWGPKKIQAQFVAQYGTSPSLRTLARLRQRLKLARRPRRRPRKACRRYYRRLTRPAQPHHVWTVDFKGRFRTGAGDRVEALTVRDLYSRYVLLVRVLPDQRWLRIKGVFAGLFRQCGVPAIIRVDNGSPFASSGPAGLARLSVWWLRLGIRVEFTRPGHPEDNGAHEQLHRVLKRETLRPPTRTRRGQQHRLTVWVRNYNHVRPHEALGQQPPARWYRRNLRRAPGAAAPISYPAGYTIRHVRHNGEIRWRGRRRFIGEAFVGERLGLKSLRHGVHRVYYAHVFLGHLHDSDPGAMRPAQYQRRRGRAKS